MKVPFPWQIPQLCEVLLASFHILVCKSKSSWTSTNWPAVNLSWKVSCGYAWNLSFLRSLVQMGPLFFSSKSHVKSLSQIWIYLILHPDLNKNCATNHISKIFLFKQHVFFSWGAHSTVLLKLVAIRLVYGRRKKLMTTSERFFGEILFTKYAHKVLFPRKKSRNKWQQNIFLLTVTKSPPSVSSAFSHGDTRNCFCTLACCFSCVQWLPVTVDPPFCNQRISQPLFLSIWLGFIFFFLPISPCKELTIKQRFFLKATSNTLL